MSHFWARCGRETVDITEGWSDIPPTFGPQVARLDPGAGRRRQWEYSVCERHRDSGPPSVEVRPEIASVSSDLHPTIPRPPGDPRRLPQHGCPATRTVCASAMQPFQLPLRAEQSATTVRAASVVSQSTCREARPRSSDASSSDNPSTAYSGTELHTGISRSGITSVRRRVQCSDRHPRGHYSGRHRLLRGSGDPAVFVGRGGDSRRRRRSDRRLPDSSTVDRRHPPSMLDAEAPASKDRVAQYGGLPRLTGEVSM